MSMTELERQRAHYKEIRDRIWSAKPKPKVSPASSIKTVPVKQWKPDLPMWREADIHFDAHVIDYRIWQVDQASPKRAYVRRRAAELGFSLDQIASAKRTRDVVAARQLLMWEVRTIWPEASYPEIGRMFGGRDHTTILHAFNKIEAQMRCDL